MSLIMTTGVTTVVTSRGIRHRSGMRVGDGGSMGDSRGVQQGSRMRVGVVVDQVVLRGYAVSAMADDAGLGYSSHCSKS